MITILAQAKGTGRVISRSRFKKNEWVDLSTFLGLTILIPDVLVDMLVCCKSIDENTSVETLCPDGPRSPNLAIVILGNNFQVNCSQILARGSILNPLKAEFGANYDILFTLSANNREIEKRLAAVVTNKYECKKVIDTIED